MVKNGTTLLPTTSLQLSWTPLHIAIDSRHLETIQLLLERGADVDAKDMVSQKHPYIPLILIPPLLARTYMVSQKHPSTYDCMHICNPSKIYLPY